jgi:hypothetical protein
VKLFGVQFWFGRLISVMSVLATALAAALIVWDLTKHRFAAYLAGGCIMAMPHFMVWSTLMRVDAFALGLAAVGFWLFLRGARWAGVGLFAVGAFTRRTTIAAMGAAFLNDARTGGLLRAGKLFAAQIALITALFIGANIATRGGMYEQLSLHTSTSLGKAWTWQQLWSLLWVPGNPCPLKLWPVYFVITVVAAVWSVFHREGRPLTLWFLLAGLIFLTGGRIGSAHNYLMEPTAIGMMLFGVMYAELSRSHIEERGRRQAPALRTRGEVLLMLLAGALTLQMVWTTLHLPYTLSILQPRVDPRSSQRVVELVRQTDGPVLVEDTGLTLLAGKEPPLMPFEFTMMAKARALDPEPVYQAVREGRYPLIVLRFNPLDPLEIKLHHTGEDWKGGRWPDGIIAGVQERYRLVEEMGPYFVFGPK